jgi:xanthine/uracil permease
MTMIQAYGRSDFANRGSTDMRIGSLQLATGTVTALLQALAVILKHPSSRLQAKGHATATIVSILLKVR